MIERPGKAQGAVVPGPAVVHAVHGYGIDRPERKIGLRKGLIA